MLPSLSLEPVPLTVTETAGVARTAEPVTTGTSWIKMIRSTTSNNQGNAWTQRTSSGGGYYGGGYSGGGGGGHK